MTPDQRATLVDALREIARYVPVEHRAYGSTLAEMRQRVRDTAWAGDVDRKFAGERAFLAGGALEALASEGDDALLRETVEVIADSFTHEDWEEGSILSIRHGWVQGDFVAASHCANIARRALAACGFPGKPVTGDLDVVARVVAEVEGRARAAHARLAAAEAAEGSTAR